VRALALPLAGAILVFVGCGGGGGSGTTLERGPAIAGFEFTDESAVREGESIATRFTCDGESVSPALAWTGVPGGTAELALVLEDPDAPGGTFTHWLLYRIGPSTTELSGATAREGKNDFGDTGYGGPCPPSGEEHRYVFRLLALHAAVDLEEGADRAAFDEALSAHVLAEARLTATYARP
jgi:Raf kinase inhibitor-like YbhB/YbcL family protein